MGVMSWLRGLIGLARPAQELAEVFRVNAEADAGRAHSARMAALAQLAAEARKPRRGWFDGLIDGLNRLPRPALAFGTIGLFVFAGADPAGFVEIMGALGAIPEPLWYLLGAVVAFYFGARELDYSRKSRQADMQALAVTRKELEISAPDSLPEDVARAEGSEPARRVASNPVVAEILKERTSP